jgi:hypothetical protein
VSQIKALVVNCIEGLSYDNVTVALFPADGAPLEPGKPIKSGGARPVSASTTNPASVARAEASATTLPLISGGAIGLLVCGSGGFMWWRRRREPQVAGALEVRPLAKRAPADLAHAQTFGAVLNRVANEK